MQAVTLYSTEFCPFCLHAKRLFDQKGVAYRNISIDGNMQRRNEMMAKSGRRTVPQIWIGQRHIGGCDDLYALEQQGQLDKLLQTTS